MADLPFLKNTLAKSFALIYKEWKFISKRFGLTSS